MRFVPLFCLLIAACNRAPETKEAVRQAVIDSVEGRVNLGAMEIDILQVDFKGATAEATADFRAKGAAPGSGIQMRYTLERKDAKWVVAKRSESGASSHQSRAPAPDGGGASLPPGHPPLEGAPKGKP